MPSLHPVPPVTRSRVPYASDVERAFTGTFTRIAPCGACTLSPSAGFSPALCHYGLCLPMQARGLSLSPAIRGKGVLDRIAGLLVLGKRLTYKCQPPSVGLLGKASIEHGQAILMASGSTSRHFGGWLIPPPFIWLVARLLRLMPSIRKTSIERFYVTDNRDRKIDRGDSIPLLREINQRFGNDVRSGWNTMIAGRHKNFG